MGVLGDIGDAFPNGEFAEMYRGEWVLAMIRDVKSNRDFSDRTIELAKWARQQLKRQVELVSGNNQS
jgi:importin subunit beta-1